jgi:hypothetical protein
MAPAKKKPAKKKAAKKRAPAKRKAAKKAVKKKGPGRPRVIEKLVAEVEEQFEPLTLPDAVEHSKTRAAQERLNAALTSVNHVLRMLYLSRAVDQAIQEKTRRGRLPEPQIDILRAVVVFAGAGLDSALKKLIKDTVRRVAIRNETAKERFLKFSEKHLAGTGTSSSHRKLAEVLVHGKGTQEALLEQYEWRLTGDSLQSANQVSGVCGALGVEDSKLRMRLKANSVLDKMFKARNQIVHELDLTDRRRRSRTLPNSRKFAKEALSVGQAIINSVGNSLG